MKYNDGILQFLLQTKEYTPKTRGLLRDGGDLLLIRHLPHEKNIVMQSEYRKNAAFKRNEISLVDTLYLRGIRWSPEVSGPE